MACYEQDLQLLDEWSVGVSVAHFLVVSVAYQKGVSAAHPLAYLAAADLMGVAD